MVVLVSVCMYVCVCSVYVCVTESEGDDKRAATRSILLSDKHDVFCMEYVSYDNFLFMDSL